MAYLHGRPYGNLYNRMQPPFARPDLRRSLCKYLLHSSKNKNPSPVFALQWGNHGKRIIIGCNSGEFLLWNGLNFKFESLLQAHNKPIRVIRWRGDDQFILSGDDSGSIKVWKSTLKILHTALAKEQAHDEAVRDLHFSPYGGAKFVSCSDDHLAKVWDFLTMKIETVLKGHGWDVKCTEWHPYKSLIATGSKDSLVKLWDPKSARELKTLHPHKNAVTKVKWSKDGDYLLTGSRDTQIKLYDLRMMELVQEFRGHAKEVSSLEWHPSVPGMLASGGFDGTLVFWQVGRETPTASVEAHMGAIWDLGWHPLGHILATGSNDGFTKFYSRVAPVPV